MIRTVQHFAHRGGYDDGFLAAPSLAPNYEVMIDALLPVRRLEAVLKVLHVVQTALVLHELHACGKPARRKRASQPLVNFLRAIPLHGLGIPGVRPKAAA